MERILINLLYVALGATTGIHKLLGDFPPSWFREKFADSLIGWIPGGIEISFAIIVILELAIAGLFSLALIKREYAKGTTKTYSLLGFYASLILFLILFFGSFLVQNYDNGFFDFMYFATTVYLMKFYVREDQNV
jgi:hypothetical protein